VIQYANNQLPAGWRQQAEGAVVTRLTPGDIAPDFALLNHQGRPVRLSELCVRQNVLLVFNLGFV
jgi:hypothetical protein